MPPQLIGLGMAVVGMIAGSLLSHHKTIRIHD
jgi:hypothetical protein